MSRRDNNFDSPEKAAWRLRNVRFLRDHGRAIWGANGKLRCSILEYIGRSGIHSYNLYKKTILENSSQFIGVDKDLNVAQFHRDNKVEFNTIRNDGLYSAQELYRTGTPVGVINMDGYTEAGHSDWWIKSGYILKDLAMKGIGAVGELALLMNHTLDSRAKDKRGTPSTRLRAHVEALCSSTAGYMAGKALKPLEILPRGTETIIDNTKFCGDVGACQVYRGNRFRMVTLRVILR